MAGEHGQSCNIVLGRCQLTGFWSLTYMLIVTYTQLRVLITSTGLE